MRDLQGIKKIVIKVGSSSLCNQKGQIEKEKILYLILQISKLIELDYSIVLVSSGAIAAGMGALGLKEKPQTIPEKQALAAIGQAKLMQIYEEIFQLFDIECAQVLLNHGDFDDRKRLINLTNTMHSLMHYGVIPIVNENDALAVDEIKVGDNDTLAALIVPVVEADMLILVSDIDGLYNVDDDIRHMAGDTSSGLGTGGMATKIRAAKIVNTQLVYLLSKYYFGEEGSIHIEVLLPAFVLGMVMKTRHVESRGERMAASGISFLFMFLVGLSMPLFIGMTAATGEAASSVTGSQPMMVLVLPWE